VRLQNLPFGDLPRAKRQLPQFDALWQTRALHPAGAT
jgi:hypothetical protein